jgi:hypothetical protein
VTEGRTATALLTTRAAAVVDAGSGPAEVLRRLIDSGHVAEPLRAIGVNPASLRGALHPDSDSVTGSGRVLEHAEQEARALGHDQVDAIHLLMGLLYNDLPGVARPLVQLCVNLYDLRTYALRAKQHAPVRPRHGCLPGWRRIGRRGRLSAPEPAPDPYPARGIRPEPDAAGSALLIAGAPVWPPPTMRTISTTSPSASVQPA